MTDLNGKRFQLTFQRPSTMLQFSNFLCDPPLGQSTVVPRSQDQVTFTVLIESSISFSEQPWETVIWHNCHENGEWNGLDLQEVETDIPPLAVTSQGRPKVYRRYFRGSISRPKAASAIVKFTLKFRTTRSAWRWANDGSSLTDGALLFQMSSLPSNLEDCFDNFNSAFEVKASPSDVPDTKLWQLSLPVGAATGSSTYLDELIGLPRDINRWFAIVRIWTPWLCPRHGQGQFGLTEEGVVLSFLRTDGLHLVLVAVSGQGNIYASFKDDKSGGVVLSSRNDGQDTETTMVIAAVGFEHSEALAACMYHARKLFSGAMNLGEEFQAQVKAHEDGEVDPYWMSEWYDGLTYCTWNGLGQGLNEKKIFDALDDLDKNNIKVTNLIIDDNWQTLDNPGAPQTARGWVDFDANKEGFPNGLKHTVSTIREKHPTIEHVAVWHAILGYWGGIAPKGTIASKYKTREVVTASTDRIPEIKLTVVDAEDVDRLYDDFYSFLLKSGVDSVKTDAQFFLDLMDNPEDRRALFKKYQDAWIVASLKYFGTKVISCMSLVPAIIFHSQLPHDKPRLMVRNSDDFFPEIPSSHPWHIWTNSFTSVLTQYLNALPDWDMFQTSHEYSTFHAAARCVSGGPIYITDTPGEHSIDLIDQMTATGIRSDKRIILRPSTLGKTIPSNLYTGYEEERFLKVGAYHGRAETGYGILGVFNVSSRALYEMILLKDFPGVIDNGKYVVRAHTTGEVSRVMTLSDPLSMVSLFLDVKQSEILTAYPVQIIRDIAIAPLGLIGKMTGAAAIVDAPAVEPTADRISVGVNLKATGVLGYYIANTSSTQKPFDLEKDFMASISERPVPLHTASLEGDVLRIDLERALEEMQLPKTWSNELSVELLIYR